MRKFNSMLTALFIIVLSLVFYNPSQVYGQNKPYKAGEILSSTSYNYGKIEVRMKTAKGSGLLSNFFTYKNGSEKPDTF